LLQFHIVLIVLELDATQKWQILSSWERLIQVFNSGFINSHNHIHFQ
jgi:hypothetical protein